ncbi:MAG: GNAT family N-acetyltransferase [Armatimonadota bacterium]|jgi:GNAT superfamily N-acetyltransferase
MASEEIIIREAQPRDLRIITQFVVAMARDSEDVALDSETVEAAVRTALEDRSKGVYFVAEGDEGLIGQALVTAEWSDWHCCEYWWLQSVYVVPEWRRRGVFGRIYRHILDRAREARAAAVRLYVTRQNEPALLAYRRLSMTETDYVVLEQRL